MKAAPNLYTYCIPVDDGAAPNPFWGACTLAICKPAIRRTAKVGDWIVGTGSMRSPVKGIAGRVVYAMRVTKVLSMRDYDQWTKRNLKDKIPNPDSKDWRHHLGDSIYDYSRTGRPKLRNGVHYQENKPTDLRGKNVLLSQQFYYFGDRPIKLPKFLQPIVHQTQGHKVHLNKEYVEDFVRWLESRKLRLNHLYGAPGEMSGSKKSCSARRRCAETDLRHAKTNIC